MDRVSLIFKVLSGEASPRERSHLQLWIQESDDNRQEFQDIRLLWKNTASINGNSFADRSSFETLKLRMQRHTRRKHRARMIMSTLLLIGTISSSIILVRHTWLSTPKKILFNQTEMADVIQVLEKRYDIVLKVSDPDVLKCRYTALLLNVNDEAQVLRSIEHSLNMKAIPNGKNRYVLAGGHCV